jgi:hypothetical protein
VQDCVQSLLAITTPGAAAAEAGIRGTVPTAPVQPSFLTAGSQGSRFGVPFCEEDGSGSSSGSSHSRSESGLVMSQAPIVANPSLDVDHCTIARMMMDEDRLWNQLHEPQSSPADHDISRTAGGVEGRASFGMSSPSSGSPTLRRDDVFSAEAVQQEA